MYLLPKLQSKQSFLIATVMNIGLGMARQQQFRPPQRQPACSYCWCFLLYQVTNTILIRKLFMVYKTPVEACKVASYDLNL